MPIGFCTAMWTAKNTMLFLSARQNGVDQSLSVNSVVKLAKPTK